MSRRHRYHDRKKAPVPATLIRYIPGEAPINRHARRLALNLSGEAEVRGWSDENGLTLRIKNQGHHWIFERLGFFAEWWPSSAKLVIGKRYREGVHVHDWKQAQTVIARELGRYRFPAQKEMF